MNTIDDFVERRWRDAKCALRRLDSEFVDRVESTVRLQSAGLATPWQFDIAEAPSRRLSTEWHRLLKACLDLTMEVSRLQVAAQGLRADAYQGMAPVDVGQRAEYHLSSWFTRAVTLSERTNEVIEQTVKTYLADSKPADKLVQRYRERVDQACRRYKTLRNDFVHATPSSLASVVTSEDLWESNVAGGMTPEMFLNEFRYPDEYVRLRDGKYGVVATETEFLCDSLGSILGSLENDLQPVGPR